MFSFGSQPIKHFNPLPPCGGRQHVSDSLIYTVRFQSTPSVWRETKQYNELLLDVFISIHSLRVEGDKIPEEIRSKFTISIHSLRVEGDPRLLIINYEHRRFQSTPSVWRETMSKI